MSFNVRVYGLLTDEKRGVLVSDELIKGKMYTKFPGGGMEYGEGTRDCLRREFGEEMKLKIEVLNHFYTTDFFQESAFRQNDQIISVYYFVKPLEKMDLTIIHKDTIEEYKNNNNPHANQESFRFISFDKLKEDMLSFSIDKVVARMLIEKFGV